MGTNEEAEAEPRSSPPQQQQLKKEEEVEKSAAVAVEKDAPVKQQPAAAVSAQEDVNLLNTYVWHTGSKPSPPAAATADTNSQRPSPQGGGGGGQQGNSMERTEKSTSNKWGKMNWRKAHSEDHNADRAVTGGGGGARGEEKSKQEKPAGGLKKNPFRRALSEPPGSLLSTMRGMSGQGASASSSTTTTTGGASGEASGSNGQDSAQRGKFMKYLQNVSRKIKRPRLQSRPSQSHIDPHGGETGSVVDAEPVSPEDLRLSWVPPQDVPVWDINSCLLQDGLIIIREDEPLLRTRNRASSLLSGGSLSLQNLAESHTNLECTPDHVTPSTTNQKKGQNVGVKGMIMRRIQATGLRKSNTQLDSAGLTRSKQLGSAESLSVPVTAAENLDLSADQSTIIRPVHSSILGEKYCFEVINSENNHCFGCSSAAERDRWIENLRRTVQPNKDNCERTEHSLSLWVTEGKALPPKRRYYCELHLDGTLFARTTSRDVGKPTTPQSTQTSDGGGATSGLAPPGGQIFWGELFELDNLPPVAKVTLHLFRDEDAKKKRHSRDESYLYPLGSVTLPLADIQGRAFQEKWYPIIPFKPPSGSGNGKDQLGPQASLRIKARFQNLQVLPIERYKEFAEHLTLNYLDMCGSLEPLLNVRDKEELAGALVHVLQSIGKAKDFLIDLGSAEVQRLGEKEALIFRENTLATKAIDEYMKLVGQKFLIDTLRDFTAQLYESAESCEVDPRKCPSSDLANNQRHLRHCCERVVQRITEMHSSFPVELNEIFSNWVEECRGQGRPEIGQRLISASLFLRFLCPAILSPSLFGLIQPYPEGPTQRTLTLTAKVVQNLANFTSFGEKEEYMLFMNDFLEQHWERMKDFLQMVSNPDSELDMARFDGYVDLPLRLAVLHGLLVDIIRVMKQDTIDHLEPLPSILNQITDHLGPNAPRITVNSVEISKPVYVPPKDLSKYSPHHNSMQQLSDAAKQQPPGSDRPRRGVARTRSVPSRPHAMHKQPKRQASSESLNVDKIAPQNSQQQQQQQLKISHPETPSKVHNPNPVPWIKEQGTYQIPAEHEQINLLDKELTDLRLGVEQVTERELEMAKRLEDFIVQSQDQNAQLQAEVNDLRSLLATREEQLASATFRLGVIEEEREEDERKLSIAMAAAERMNVLEEQFAGLLQNVHQIKGPNSENVNNALHCGMAEAEQPPMDIN
ncbi:ras GTPase-activating protein nGAP isoform X2 [Engraulis encrasicolus]|uniref:ras GTPase-activating protein nGAP isoform X2 n=1 Tax=Engraulis encrasicolus TaxID=184585 RepID=UPI002FD4925D